MAYSNISSCLMTFSFCLEQSLESYFFTFLYEQPILDSDQLLTINAYFQPLDISTMTKDFRHSYTTNLDELQFLHSWKHPHIAHMNFGVRHFKSFLPKIKQIKIGQPYWLIKVKSDQHRNLQHLSSNRYYPPEVDDEHIIIHRLLEMFHQRPFILSRFPPQGALAVVRARYGPYLDIIFRIHAEYQLNTAPYHPFWYTPAQFQGRLVIKEDATEIIYFRMHVPSNKKLNVDMEWLSDGSTGSNMEVDIGYMPQMELRSSAPSLKVLQNAVTDNNMTMEADLRLQFMKPMNETLYSDLLISYKWDNEITEEEVLSILEKTFYPFKEVVAELYEKLAILNNKSDVENVHRAQCALDSYKFPVESMIHRLDGTVIANINANDLMNFSQKSVGEFEKIVFVNDGMDSTTKPYIDFLEQALNTLQ
ncbi:unnamed protein product [Didymodactylos carnosus]|uniref:Uncharacterized protein n=1 Tax=Didymodactylos carnosus TaxID=1234261 RepID=A0A813R4B8_9BILA|nr:unnamed protein product [Didymodactylos carnosus]CAF3559393.1 unnamed protein product [Didymodactylos carnosus]